MPDVEDQIVTDKTPTVKEKVEDAEQKVLYPGTHTTQYTILGKKILLRPLPIGWAKRVCAQLVSLQDTLAKAAKTDDETESAKVLEGSDIKAIDALMQASLILFKFYHVDISLQQLEDDAAVEDLIGFCKRQLALNGENDFLLQPLRTIIVIASASGQAMKQLQNSLSTLVSQKVGESVFQSSLTPTPKDS